MLIVIVVVIMIIVSFFTRSTIHIAATKRNLCTNWKVVCINFRKEGTNKYLKSVKNYQYHIKYNFKNQFSYLKCAIRNLKSPLTGTL